MGQGKIKITKYYPKLPNFVYINVCNQLNFHTNKQLQTVRFNYQEA